MAQTLNGRGLMTMTTDWEAHYQRGETPWDKGAPSPGLVDWLAGNRVGGRVLVPGCGMGHDVRALSAQGADVVGLDLAPSAVAAARAFAPAGAERYEEGDLFALPAKHAGSFDWVWEHTCFCAIDPARRADYVEAVARVLKPGGHLLAVFYLDPGSKRADEGPPFGVSLAELDAHFGARFECSKEWLPARAYPGREGREWMRLLRKR